MNVITLGKHRHEAMPAGRRWAQFEARCRQSTAQLGGWKFTRDEANER